ncbi:MAG: EAL domain-containing protein, partial [Desulfovibrio sp.]
LAILFSAVIIGYLFTRSISRPLTRLTEYAKRVAAHDFSQPIDITSRDEVGTLAQAMNSMAHDLAQLISGLERSVEDATGELQETLTYVSAILANMANGVLVTDSSGRIMRFNPAFLEMVQYKEQEVMGRNSLDMFGLDMMALAGRRNLAAPLRGVVGVGHDAWLGTQGFEEMEEGANCVLAQNLTVETRAKRRDGEVFPVDLSIAVVSLRGAPHAIGIMRDITERKLLEQEQRQAKETLERMVEERTRELKAAEANYRSIFENAVEGIFQTTPEGTYISANPALARIYGYSNPEELMRELTDISEQLYVDKGRREAFLRIMEDAGEVTNFESRVRRKDGKTIWIAENARRVCDESGEILYYEGSVENITLRKVAEDQLKHQAFHDPLTKLPNRQLFHDHLHMVLERSKRRKDYIFAVLYLDLDRFKIVNDSLGHDIGDELLTTVARTLERCVRSMDTVARFGGDEFAILLEEIGAPRVAIKIARRIMDEITQPMTLSGHEVFTSASIGIVLITDDYDRPEFIIRDADTAMYRAKEQGKARFKVFNQRMHEQALRILELETDLRRAVDRMDFFVVYQPLVDLEEQRIAGFEALLRWEHPQFGMISPTEFIPLAEDTGLIYTLGHSVLEQVCKTITHWRERFPQHFAREDPLFASVNISAKQFLQPLLVGQVEQILMDMNVEPRLLKLEITENALMDHATQAQDMLVKLRKIGLGMCIDDFGTGYSSLSYLQRFPIDTIKIDRSFVMHIEHDPDSLAIVRSIVSLGLSLGHNIVAEGVETHEQLALLKESGCRLAQGYLFSKPVNASKVEAMLAASGIPFALEAEL